MYTMNRQASGTAVHCHPLSLWLPTAAQAVTHRQHVNTSLRSVETTAVTGVQLLTVFSTISYRQSCLNVRQSPCVTDLELKMILRARDRMVSFFF